MYDAKRLADQLLHQLQFSPTVSLKTLSVSLGVGRHTLAKCSRLFLGDTFRNVRKNLVLAKAEQLIKTRPDLSLKEIAAELQYSSIGAFSKAFRAHWGQAPSVYRTCCTKTSFGDIYRQND